MEGLDDTAKEPTAPRDDAADPEEPSRQLTLAFDDTQPSEGPPDRTRAPSTVPSVKDSPPADPSASDPAVDQVDPSRPSHDPGDTLLVKVASKPPPSASKEADTDQPKKRPRISRPLAVGLAIAIALGGAGIAVARTGADPSHVESGVTAGGVPLAGRDEPSTTTALGELEAKLAHTSIPLVLGNKEVRFEPSQAGFAIDDAATLQSVFLAGRTTSFAGKLKALGRGRIDVPLTVTLDESLLSDLIDDWEARLIEDRPSLGAVRFEGLEPKADPPRAGRKIKRPELVAALRSALTRGDGSRIEVPVETITPTLAPEDVDKALAEVKSLVSANIVLTRAPSAEDVAEASAAEEQRKKRVDEDRALAPKKKPKKRKRGPRNDDAPLAPPPPPPVAQPKTLELTFTPADLVAMVRTTARPDGSGLDVTLDEEEINRKIATIAGKLADSARDARFEVDDKDQVTIVPSRSGTKVDAKKVADAVFAASKAPDRHAELPVDHGAPPSLTTEAAEGLHIKGLVTEFTTHHPCCQPRVINIHRIADIMNDALVKPGDTFSVNKYVGPRTVSRGFVIAPSIGDGEMVDTVGGGISQFATTLFNALFDGGYAIRERKAHSFYFSRYPMGIEATLSDPSPDLVFVNDTDAGLLIKAHYDNTSITVKLYGDNGGRRVERHVSGAFDLTEPKSEYEADDRLEPDEEKVKDKGQSGWSVWASRVITMPGGEKREEKRKITYRARPRLVRTHSCNIPKGEPDYTGRPCPKKEKTEEGSSSSGTPDPSSGAGDPSLSP